MESERKPQILDTAAQLFSERGYRATSMRELARAVELQGGWLYSHFQGKEELLWRVLERAAAEFQSVIHAITLGRAPPDERLRAAIHAHVRVIAHNLPAATVYFHEWKHLAEPRRSAFLARRDEYEQAFRALVAHAIAGGALPGAEPKWATLLILSTVNWIYQSATNG